MLSSTKNLPLATRQFIALNGWSEKETKFEHPLHRAPASKRQTFPMIGSDGVFLPSGVGEGESDKFNWNARIAFTISTTKCRGQRESTVGEIMRQETQPLISLEM
jgi:hypothetical protein